MRINMSFSNCSVITLNAALVRYCYGNVFKPAPLFVVYRYLRGIFPLITPSVFRRPRCGMDNTTACETTFCGGVCNTFKRARGAITVN